MKEIPKEILFAVYGTLRNLQGNNRLLQRNGVEFLGEFLTEPNFTMESQGGFPAVYLTGNTRIVTEVFKVTNPEVISHVFSLEGYTGKKNHPSNWYDVEEIDTPYGKANMFVFKNRFPNPSRVIESGDWIKK